MAERMGYIEREWSISRENQECGNRKGIPKENSECVSACARGVAQRSTAKAQVGLCSLGRSSGKINFGGSFMGCVGLFLVASVPRAVSGEGGVLTIG